MNKKLKKLLDDGTVCFLDSQVGRIDWSACDNCKHCREDEGGCDPLDKGEANILGINVLYEYVFCKAYEPKTIEEKKIRENK